MSQTIGAYYPLQILRLFNIDVLYLAITPVFCGNYITIDQTHYLQTVSEVTINGSNIMMGVFELAIPGDRVIKIETDSNDLEGRIILLYSNKTSFSNYNLKKKYVS